MFLLIMASTGASAQSVFTGIAQRNTVGGPAPLIDTRDFSITPLVGLQETFTDNALLTQIDKKADFITRPMVGAQIDVHGPFTASLLGHAYYDAYASQDRLSGFSADVQGTAKYDVVPAFLSIEGDVMMQNASVSTFGAPAIDRVGPQNQITIATYDIGPHLTTTIDDFADVDLVGRFSQIFFDDPNASTANLPNNDAMAAFAGSVDTGERFRGYELVTNVQAEKDDHHFEGYSLQQTLYVQIFPQIRLIGRGGYDYVMQPGIVSIRDGLWSAGLQYVLDPQSTISVEYGQRYGHAAYRGEIHLQLSQQLYIEGTYFETIQPNQLQINSAFNNFTVAQAQLPPQLVGNPFLINTNIDNQTALSKQGTLAVVYTWATQSLWLRADWNDRMLLPSTLHDRSLFSSVEYQRTITADLTFATSLDYNHTFANPLYGTSEAYGGRIGLQYQINSTMQGTAGYAYQRQLQLFVNGESITENVVYAAVSKRF